MTLAQRMADDLQAYLLTVVAAAVNVTDAAPWVQVETLGVAVFISPAGRLSLYCRGAEVDSVATVSTAVAEWRDGIDAEQWEHH